MTADRKRDLKERSFENKHFSPQLTESEKVKLEDDDYGEDSDSNSDELAHEDFVRTSAEVNSMKTHAKDSHGSSPHYDSDEPSKHESDQDNLAT